MLKKLLPSEIKIVEDFKHPKLCWEGKFFLHVVIRTSSVVEFLLNLSKMVGIQNWKLMFGFLNIIWQ